MYTVKRTGRTWSIYRGSTLVEGGFFSREAAQETCQAWNDMQMEYPKLQV